MPVPLQEALTLVAKTGSSRVCSTHSDLVRPMKLGDPPLPRMELTFKDQLAARWLASSQDGDEGLCMISLRAASKQGGAALQALILIVATCD